MKIILLFPPPWTNQPYSSLPALTACLRREGYPVTPRDINIEAVEALLSPQRLSQALQYASRQLAQLECRAESTPEVEAERRALAAAMVSADYVVQHIDSAKRALRSRKEFFDVDRLTWATNLLKRARELLSAEYFPSSWTTDNFFMPSHNAWVVSDVLAATHDERHNLFLSYFRDTVVPSVEAQQPDLIGLSITHTGQLIPGFTLARLLKRRCPQAHVCLGGAILSTLRDDLQRNPAIFALADSLVVGEGEHALVGLVRALEARTSLAAVPNLLYLESGQVHGTPAYVENVDDLPAPDYSGLPLDLYLTPEVIACLPTERSCYWKRCAFCTIPDGMHYYRPRKMELVLEDMKQVSRQLGTRCFFLANDATSPARMQTLARMIADQELGFIWQTEARLEKTLTPDACRRLAQGGCRRLFLGLESGSQRVLDLMEKGITLEQAARVIHHCHQAGISTHLFLMVGFPTETREEARETFAFVDQYRQAIDSISYSEFGLFPGSKIHRDPGRYDIPWIEKPPPEALGWSLARYQVNRGMTPDEVSAEMHPEAVRFFRKVFRIVNDAPAKLLCSNHLLTQYINSVLLNYLAHFDARRVEDLPAMAGPGYLSPGDGVAALDYILQPVEGLRHRPLDADSIALFNPANGRVLVAPASAQALLALCQGGHTLQQLADRLAESGEGADFIKRYYVGLRLGLQLVEQGFLRTTASAAVMPAHES